MDPRKVNLNAPTYGVKNSERVELGNRTTQMARVFITPEYSGDDTPDAIAFSSLPAFVTPVQPPADIPSVERDRRSNATTSSQEGATAEPEVIADEESERYNMQHKRRGVALIFNHEFFEDPRLKARKGADEDRVALEEILKMLSFEVRYYKDLTASALKKTLRDVAMEDHQDADCLFVAVMTHGDEGDLLLAKDNPLKVEDIWQPFTAERAISLVGKPKIFLIQACRGSAVEDSVWVSDATDSTPSKRPYTIPTRADFLVARSSMEGFFSWREPDEGSWFIQDFCNVMKENGRQKDLLTIMTLTLKRVAYNRTSCTPNQKDLHQKKQMPVFSSTLTKFVYFDSTAV